MRLSISVSMQGDNSPANDRFPINSQSCPCDYRACRRRAKVHLKNGSRMKSLATVVLFAAMGIWGLASIPAQNVPSKPPWVEVRIISPHQHEASGRVSYEEVAPVPHLSGRDSVFAYSAR